MKYRNIILSILGLGLIATSCEDGNKNYTEEFDSVYYYKQNGLNEFDFYSINKGVAQTITVGRGGHSLTGRTIIDLVPFSEEELAAYNKSIDASYKLLDPEYYEMPASVVFDDGVEYKNIDVVFKGNMSELAKTGDYLLPIRLLPQSGSVNKDKNVIYLKPNIIVPSVVMDPTGKNTINMQEGVNETRNFELTYYLDVVNEWNLKLRMEDSEDELQRLVDEYNRTMGVNYALLPIANREYESLVDFPAGESLVTSNVIINNEGLQMDDYLLPVVPKKVIGMPFDVKTDVCYIHVMVNGQLEDITLTKEMISASSTQSGGNIVSVIDGNTKTYWESIWSSNTDPKHDATYGVYIDIDLSKVNKTISRQLHLDYATRDYANAVPYTIVVYAGTSANDLRPIGELTKNKNNLPVAGATWTKDLPNFSLGRTESSYIRISFLESKTGGLTNAGNISSGDQPCVAISELKLSGK